MEDLKKPATTRIFRAWVEDWEEKAIVTCDCVCEAQLLKKYKGLVFFDPDFGKLTQLMAQMESTVTGTRKRGLIRVGRLYVKMRMEICRGGISLMF